MATLRDLHNQLKSTSKQVKYGKAQALTRVARAIEAKEKEHIEQIFDNPTPFTLRSVKSRGARRDNLAAKVFIQPIAAQYLEPFQYGGVHKLDSGTLLNPKQIRLNKYGNLARNRTKTLLAKEDVFSGSVQTSQGEIRGNWQRKRVRKGAKRKKGNLKTLIRFGDALPVRQQMDFYGVAEEAFNKEMPSALREEIQKAFETAK